MMAEVKAYECEECGGLGRAWALPEDFDPAWADFGDGSVPPEGWLMVLVQRVSMEPADIKRPVEVFCSEKCMGLHYRPIQRRGKGTNGADTDEEDHAAS